MHSALDTVSEKVFRTPMVIHIQGAALYLIPYRPKNTSTYEAVSYTHLTLPTTPYV